MTDERARLNLDAFPVRQQVFLQNSINHDALQARANFVDFASFTTVDSPLEREKLS